MDLASLDPFSPAFLEDPYGAFKLLRDQAPVHFVEKRNMWIVSRYDDVVAVARNTAVFSSTGGVGYDWNSRPMMPMYDPPEHARLRRMVAKHFTPAAVTAYKPRIATLVDVIITRALSLGTVDAVDDIALPLSLGTMAELLGVPFESRADLRRWSQGTVEDLAGGLTGAAARQTDDLRREFNVFLRSLIEDRRATLAERKNAVDVITALVAAREGERLSSQELIAFCVLLLVAGYETTINSIVNGLLALLENPDECTKLCRDPKLVGPAVEEMVRFDSPVLSFFRNTLTDAPVSGVTIPKGSKVMIAFASGNRDERRYADPDAFRVDRDLPEHLGFGVGIHFCLGAPLARLQMTQLGSALLERGVRFELAGAPVRSASVLFRGCKTLPVRVTTAKTAVSVPAGAPVLGDYAPLFLRPSSETTTMQARFEPTPFRLEIPESELAYLRERLERTRWPTQVENAGWDYGTELGYLRELTTYWKDSYDWRKHERAINQYPQFKVRIDDVDLHYLHIRGSGPGPRMPLLFLHGWPGPFWTFSKVIEQLTSGADQPFDLVVASLPGFTFSSASPKRGMGTRLIAEVMAKLMQGLGYEKYGIVAEDWGAGVASRLGLVHRENVVGIHLNMPHENPPRDQMADLTDEERAWLKDMMKLRDRELTHFVTFGAKPQTVAYGVDDSPVGVAAWLVEKYRAWSDCDNDVERVYSKDELLTNVMLYWLSGSFGSSVRLYHEVKQLPWFLGPGERIEVPTAILLCKKEFVQPPRRWIERVYNLSRLTHVEHGGHFAAWEQPKAVAEDVRAFFASLPR